MEFTTSLKIFSMDSKYYETPRMVPVEISHFHLHRGYLSRSISPNYISSSSASVFTAVSKECVRVPHEQQQEIKSIFNGNYLNKV